MADENARAWLEAFDHLPEQRKVALAQWFMTQKLTSQALGVEETAWWELVEWAMHNPLDYSFVNDFPDNRANPDGSPAAEASLEARELVGAAVSYQAVADGPGIADMRRPGKQL